MYVSNNHDQQDNDQQDNNQNPIEIERYTPNNQHGNHQEQQMREEYQQMKNNCEEMKPKQIQRLINIMTLDYWLLQSQKAIQALKPKSYTSSSSFDIKSTLRTGLQLQKHISEPTQFYKYYLQQFQDNYDHLRNKTPIKGMRKAKRIIEQYLFNNADAQQYFRYPFNQLRSNLPQYSLYVTQRICIQDILNNIKYRKYLKFKEIKHDMDKVFTNSYMVNQNNLKFYQITFKLQKKFNFTFHQLMQEKYKVEEKFILYQQEDLNKKYYQIVDYDEEYRKLKGKPEFVQNIQEYQDYCPNIQFDEKYLSNKTNQLVVIQRQKQKIKVQRKRRQKDHKIIEQKNNQIPQTISTQRFKILNKNIKLVSDFEKQLQDRASKHLANYVARKIKQNPKLIGNDSQIALKNLSYDQFTEWQNKVKIVMDVHGLKWIEIN